MSAELISVAAARACILEATTPLSAEPVPVAQALDRVLAAELSASGDVPPFASSAMDGYAITAGPAGRELALVGESRAGAPSPRELGESEAIRISTGAMVPPGATAVIRQEDTTPRDGAVQVHASVEPGQNLRASGEVMRAGQVVLHQGTPIGPAELATAVSAGVGELQVYRRPSIRVLCTGDELREPGAQLHPGEIHNSNGPMLVGYAQRYGTIPAPTLLPDDRAATTDALGAALEAADVVIISGGVSVGPHDHVKPALAALGTEERFWGVALQPGKPTWFGVRDRTLVFGLPGNPVSTAVTFVLFVAPALGALTGRPAAEETPEPAILGHAVRRNRQREQALRVRLEPRDGALVAVQNGPQGSHVITSLVGADGLAMIPAGEGELASGEGVAVYPLPR